MKILKTNAIFLLSASIILSACAQLAMKVSMQELHALVTPDNSILSLIIDHTNVYGWLLAGLICYGLSMIAWLFALTKYDLSFAYPLLGITYILVYIGAVYSPLLNEPISWQRTLGIGLILIGVSLVNLKTPQAKKK